MPGPEAASFSNVALAGMKAPGGRAPLAVSRMKLLRRASGVPSAGEGESEDVRAMSVRFRAGGNGRRHFQESGEEMSMREFPDWPIDRPRTCQRVLIDCAIGGRATRAARVVHAWVAGVWSECFFQGRTQARCCEPHRDSLRGGAPVSHHGALADPSGPEKLLFKPSFRFVLV